MALPVGPINKARIYAVEVFEVHHPRKFKTQCSERKVMATIFWGTKGIFPTDYVEDSRTVTE